ncbi:MAG: hypothetical protein U0175_06975 [Caldilineaceae bacterium]
MTLSEFRTAITQSTPPENLPLPLRALWLDALGDWHGAHRLVQNGEGEASCDWVHAYLHRKEGDTANAGYWYRRAAKPMSTKTTGAEWDDIAETLLKLAQ